MTEALDETAGRPRSGRRRRRARIARATSSRSAPASARAPAHAAFVHALVDRATMPLVIDADGLNAFAGDPDRLAGREGRDVIITPHPGEMARLVGMSTDEVQASRLEIARNFAVDAPRLRRAEGPPDADRDARRQGLHQPDRQPGHGDRRHGRRAHRHDRRVAGAAARRRSRVQAGRLSARHGRRSRRGRRRGSVDDGRRPRRRISATRSWS